MFDKVNKKNKLSIQFKNKTVLITGGSRGIGLKIAKDFQLLGANVISLSSKSTASEESNLDSLLKLHNLYEKGILDQAEYENRKRKILSSDSQVD